MVQVEGRMIFPVNRFTQHSRIAHVIITSVGGRAPPARNERMPYAVSRRPNAVPGLPAPKAVIRSCSCVAYRQPIRDPATLFETQMEHLQ